MSKVDCLRPEENLTVFGFPTVQPDYPYKTIEDKRWVAKQSGVPG